MSGLISERMDGDSPPRHGTHMHQREVRLFAGVEQEVERPPVGTPLDGFKEGKPIRLQDTFTHVSIDEAHITYLSAEEISPLDAGSKIRRQVTRGTTERNTEKYQERITIS